MIAIGLFGAHRQGIRAWRRTDRGGARAIVEDEDMTAGAGGNTRGKAKTIANSFHYNSVCDYRALSGHGLVLSVCRLGE
jgi:hypothetical protein